MIPGVPFEADDSFTPETTGKYLSALNDGMARLAERGDVPRKVRIWKGRLILSGSTQGYVYEVLCPRCPFAEMGSTEDQEEVSRAR
jgi:hypothetical protein